MTTETNAPDLVLEAIEHLEEGFALFDADDCLVVCNRKYLHAFAPEMAVESARGKAFVDLVRLAAQNGYYATGEEGIEQTVARRVRSHQRGESRHELQLADGRWVAFRQYRTPSGGTVLLRLDITRLKQAQEKLSQSEEHLASFVDSAQDAIISIDDQGLVTEWNRGARRIFGYAEDEMIGHGLGALMPRQLYHQHENGVRRASVAGEHKYSDGPVELVGLRKDGSEFPLELSLSHWSVSGRFYFSGIVRDITEKKQAQAAVAQAQQETEALLHKVLPAQVVQRMHAGEKIIADRFESATVLFSDLVGFTQISSRLSPRTLVQNLNRLFSRFDELAEDLGVEKVKTIGDAYLAVAGVPEPHPRHTHAMADMALGMLQAVTEMNEKIEPGFQMRIGLHTGPLVAGIVGQHRFVYDIWGDTVNMASRFESYSEPGHIHLSAELAELLASDYKLESRGILNIRGKGEVETFFLTGV